VRTAGVRGTGKHYGKCKRWGLSWLDSVEPRCDIVARLGICIGLLA